MAYDFLKAFVETRNLRYWVAKSEHWTRSEKNHSQIPVAQSHILTLSPEAEKSKTFRRADFCAQKLSGRQKSA